MKTCTQCKIEKSLDKFGNRKDSKDGKKYYCKKCECVNSSKCWKKLYKENPENDKAYQKQQREKNSEKYKIYAKNSYSKRMQVEENRINKNERGEQWRKNNLNIYAA